MVKLLLPLIVAVLAKVIEPLLEAEASVSIVMLLPRVTGPARSTDPPLASDVVIFPFKVTPSVPVMSTVRISLLCPIASTSTVADPVAPLFKTIDSSELPVIAPSISIAPP